MRELVVILIFFALLHEVVRSAPDAATHFNHRPLVSLHTWARSQAHRMHPVSISVDEDAVEGFLVVQVKDGNGEHLRAELQHPDVHRASARGHFIVYSSVAVLRSRLGGTESRLVDVWPLPADWKLHHRLEPFVGPGSGGNASLCSRHAAPLPLTLIIKVARAVAASGESRSALLRAIRRRNSRGSEPGEGAASSQACRTISERWGGVGSATLVLRMANVCSCRGLLADLVQDPRIRWLEAGHRFTAQNKIATITLQSSKRNDRPIWQKGLTGAGQLVGVGDTGLDFDSCFFRDDRESVAFYPQLNHRHRKILSYEECVDDDGVREHRDHAGAHGTHVAGSVAGHSLGANADYNGMAPDSKIFFHDLTCGPDKDGLYLPGDLFDYYVPQYAAGARVGSNSWGSDSPKEYTAVDRETDRFMHTHPDYLAVFAAGNSAFAGILSPSAAKNVLTVGAHMNDMVAAHRGNIASFSAHGPTFDGRIKPELTAPGSPVNSAHSDGILNSNQCSLETKSGTSMATPFVAGAALLLRQYFGEGFHPHGERNASAAFTPTGALLKAMLIHATVPMEFVDPAQTPNAVEGFGRLELEPLFRFKDQATSARLWFVDNTSVSRGGAQVRCLAYSTVSPAGAGGTPEADFKATLVWMDPPTAAEGAHASVVNDLDLSVVDESGVVHYPNSGAAATRGQVVEQVKIAGAELPSGARRWLWLSVHGFEVEENEQSFAVTAWGPGLAEAPRDECIAAFGDAACPKQCSGHGSCHGGLCTCNRGYRSVDCSECDPVVLCHGNGECSVGAGTCRCFTNIAADAAQCDRCAQGFFGPHCRGTCTCGAHGTCDVEAGVCVCHRDDSRGFWDGEHCDRCAFDHRDPNTFCKQQSTWCLNKQIRTVVVGEEAGYIQINDWNAYHNSQQCMWHLRAAHHSWHVKLTFLATDVEDPFDTITVFDGDSAQAHRLERLTGKRSHVTVTSSASELFVKFQADYLGPGNGFLARFESLRSCTPEMCNGHGECNERGTCTCQENFNASSFCTSCSDGWEGPDCTRPAGSTADWVPTAASAPTGTPFPTPIVTHAPSPCVGPDDPERLLCSGHGTCIEGGTKCLCDVDHAGSHCATRCPAIALGQGQAQTCSGRGRCTVDGCVCETPLRHAGQACQVVLGALLTLSATTPAQRVFTRPSLRWRVGTYSTHASHSGAYAAIRIVAAVVDAGSADSHPTPTTNISSRLVVWDGIGLVGSMADARLAIPFGASRPGCIEIHGWRSDSFFAVVDDTAADASVGIWGEHTLMISVSDLPSHAAACERGICDIRSCEVAPLAPAPTATDGRRSGVGVHNISSNEFASSEQNGGVIRDAARAAASAVRFHPGISLAAAVIGIVAALVAFVAARGVFALCPEARRRHIASAHYDTVTIDGASEEEEEEATVEMRSVKGEHDHDGDISATVHPV